MEVLIGSNDYDALFRKEGALAALASFTYVVIPQAEFERVRNGFLEGRREGVQDA